MSLTLCYFILCVVFLGGLFDGLMFHIDFVLPSSSHNWNTLFLGTSAVADAIAEKYNTTKSQVLDHVSDFTCTVFYIYAPLNII